VMKLPRRWTDQARWTRSCGTCCNAGAAPARDTRDRGTGLRPVLGQGESHGKNTDQRSVPLYYFLMEFVDGSNLREIERAGRTRVRPWSR
jgi:hypothetical protein